MAGLGNGERAIDVATEGMQYADGRVDPAGIRVRHLSPAVPVTLEQAVNLAVALFEALLRWAYAAIPRIT
jgi:hypothetical protein